MVTFSGSSASDFLPYGVPVPASARPTAYPEPYDPRHPRPPVPNTQPEMNLSDKLPIPAFLRDSIVKYRPSSTRAAGGALFERILSGGYTGFVFDSTNGAGVYALTDADADLAMPNAAAYPTDVTITLVPPASCFGTMRWSTRPAADSATTNLFATVLVCGGGTGSNTIEKMDAAWLDKYARTYDGKPSYFNQVIKMFTISCGWGWSAQIYNFNLGQWEEKGRLCHGSAYYGITLFDTHNLTNCSHLPTSRQRSIVLLNGSTQTWSPPPNFLVAQGWDYPTDKICFTSGYYQFVATASNGWEVRTP